MGSGCWWHSSGSGTDRAVCRPLRSPAKSGLCLPAPSESTNQQTQLLENTSNLGTPDPFSLPTTPQTAHLTSVEYLQTVVGLEVWGAGDNGGKGSQEVSVSVMWTEGRYEAAGRGRVAGQDREGHHQGGQHFTGGDQLSEGQCPAQPPRATWELRSTPGRAHRGCCGLVVSTALDTVSHTFGQTSFTNSRS